MIKALRHLSQEMAQQSAEAWLVSNPDGSVELRCLDIHAFSPITLRREDRADVS